MVITNQMNNMNNVIKRVTLVFTVGVAVASSILVTNATIVDLGERHLAARLTGKQAAIDFIEADQSLDYSLTYLNRFRRLMMVIGTTLMELSIAATSAPR